jgi:hypothetical protein
MSDESSPRGSVPADAKYLTLVGGLMIVIIALLSFLWMKERSARIAAETELRRSRSEMNRLGEIFSRLAISPGEPPSQAASTPASHPARP